MRPREAAPDNIRDLPVETQVAVLYERVSNLSSDVQALKRAFITFTIGTVGSSIVFAFTVFALLGRHA